MLAELGHFALIACFSLSLWRLILSIFAKWAGLAADFYDDFAIFRLVYKINFLQFCLSFFALASLGWAFIVSDFSLAIVAQHSHFALPLLYKISAICASHEGSLLLWLVFYQFFSLKKPAGALAGRFKHLFLFWQNFTLIAFLSYLVFAANPFLRTDSDILQGRGLNPLLQDPALSWHPPLLYLGYAACSMVFAVSLAALSAKRFAGGVMVLLQYWALIACGFLTLGITLGSYWAYYELGWGGYWAWDPVENLPLLVWLSLIMVIHLSLWNKRGRFFCLSAICFAIFAFLLFLWSLFLVRSGILSSLHSFAFDNGKGYGLFLLFASLALIPIMLLANYILHHRAKLFPPINYHRLSFPKLGDSAFLFALFLLFLSLIFLLLITVLPLFYEKFYYQRIAIDSNFIIKNLSILLALILILMPFSHGLKQMRLMLKGTKLALILSLIGFMGCLAGFISFYRHSESLFYSGFFALAILLLGFYLLRLALLLKKEDVGARSLGGGLAHLGFVILLLAIIYNGAFTYGKQYGLRIGDRVTIGDHILLLAKIEEKPQENYKQKLFLFKIFANKQKPNNAIGELSTSWRFFPIEKLQTTEAGLWGSLISQIYVIALRQEELNSADSALAQPISERESLSQARGDESYYFFMIYFQAGIKLMLGGAFLMAIGVFLALLGRGIFSFRPRAL